MFNHHFHFKASINLSWLTRKKIMLDWPGVNSSAWEFIEERKKTQTKEQKMNRNEIEKLSEILSYCLCITSWIPRIIKHLNVLLTILDTPAVLKHNNSTHRPIHRIYRTISPFFFSYEAVYDILTFLATESKWNLKFMIKVKDNLKQKKWKMTVRSIVLRFLYTTIP